MAEKSTAYSTMTFGLPSGMTPHEHWLRNGRLMRAISADIGAPFLNFLQPVLGVGEYDFSPEDDRMMEEEVMELQIHNRPYFELLQEFYSGVRDAIRAQPETYSHVIDLTDIFKGLTGIYTDSRHPNAQGNRIIAERIHEELLSRQVI